MVNCAGKAYTVPPTGTMLGQSAEVAWQSTVVAWQAVHLTFGLHHFYRETAYAVLTTALENTHLDRDVTSLYRETGFRREIIVSQAVTWRHRCHHGIKQLHAEWQRYLAVAIFGIPFSINLHLVRTSTPRCAQPLNLTTVQGPPLHGGGQLKR